MRYLWNTKNCSINLVRDESPNALSVKFSDCANYICVGFEEGNVLIYNAKTQKRLRHLHNLSQRTAAVPTCLSMPPPYIILIVKKNIKY